MPALVLALNPSIDAEWRVADVRWEEKSPVRSERRWAGGKGINVARWLRYLGESPELLLPLGGKTGLELACHLRGENLSARVVQLCQPTRVNIIVTTDLGRQLRFNPSGPAIARYEWKHLLNRIERSLRTADLLVLSGSLPRGLPASAYANLIRLARRAGVKTILDCDGEALKAAALAKPFFIKPNEHELAEWSDRKAASLADATRSANDLSDVTGNWVLVSRGSDQAILVNKRAGIVFSASPPKVKPRNSVGAGDALVAGIAWKIRAGASPEEWLRYGLTVGTAATQCAPGELPNRALVKRFLKQVRLH